MSVRSEARVLHGAFLLIALILHSCDSFVVRPKLTCARNGFYNAVPAGEEENMEKYSKGEVEPGALPYASRVAADFFRAANPFSNKPAPEQRVDDTWQGLSPSAQRVLEAYQQTGFGRTSDLWTRQTDEEVLEKFERIVSAFDGDDEAAVDMFVKCKMLFQLDATETVEQFEKWVEYFEGDKPVAVEVLRKNPNLMLSEPSGPIGVTKAIASFTGIFDF